MTYIIVVKYATPGVAPQIFDTETYNLRAAHVALEALEASIKPSVAHGPIESITMTKSLDITSVVRGEILAKMKDDIYRAEYEDDVAGFDLTAAEKEPEDLTGWRAEHEAMHAKAQEIFDGTHSMDEAAMRVIETILKQQWEPRRTLSANGAAICNTEKDVQVNELLRDDGFDVDEYLSEMKAEMSDHELRAQIRRNHDVAPSDGEKLTWDNCPYCGSSDDTVWDDTAQEWKKI